jgi:PAS domain S-box-containing protein
MRNRRLTLVLSAMVLGVLAFTLLRVWPSDDLATRRSWWRDSSRRIAAALRAVGDEVAELENVSSGLGSRVRALLAGSSTGALQADATGAFALLDSMAQAVSASRALPPGTAIGLQLFTPDGARVAWAGWPQATAAIERVFLASGEEFFYTRSVSLYQILSHVVPCRNANGDVVATLLVDMPLEVDYRVNNRFLKSASLADNLPEIAAARVTFHYFPPAGNLPQRLERMREQQAAARDVRALRLAAARARRPAPVDSRSAGADTLLTTAFTWRDSLLSYGEFPGNVEPEGEVSGDGALGLVGRAVVRSRFGNPLLNVEAAGEPLEHFRSVRARARAVWGTACALLALFALFVGLMQWIPSIGARDRAAPWRRVARAGVFAAFMVALRCALLAFGPSTTRSVSRLFDPSVFATPALGGLMRSTFDLALTAIFFVVFVYGLVRVFRAKGGVETAPATPRRAEAWRLVLAGLIVWVAGLGALALIRRLTETVVVNSNPRLLGETMALTDVTVLCLHVSVFLMVSGLLLAAAFVAWGALRALGRVRPLAPCLIALAATLVLGLIEGSWLPVLLLLPLLWFVVYAPRIVQREDLVSVGIASFALVAIASGVAYAYLSREYDELRKGFVLEKSKEVSNPADNWKVVILEDVLGDFAERHEIRHAVRRPGVSDAGRLAFDLWADSPLSLLGYSCAIHVLNAQDSVVSQFSVDMPYRARIAEGGERTDTPEGDRWAVLDLTRSTPQGVVRFYRGVVNIDDSGALEDTTHVMPLLGRVIVDLPFFFESLELAARTGPRTPEVLRNVQQGGVAPRIEEPEALLLARVDDEGRVTESSSEQLRVGEHVPPGTIAAALANEWPLLRSAARAYRVVALAPPETGSKLLAGFVVPSPARHLLRWSTLLSLYMFYALVLLIVLVLLGAVPRVKNVLPTLTPGRRVGLQQKLLASFLVVALVPALLLGVFSVDFIKQRFVEENREEASYKAHSARKALINLLHGELQFFLGRADLATVLSARGADVRSLGGGRVAVLFSEAGGDSTGAAGLIAHGVGTASTEDLVVTTIDGAPHLGVFSAPVTLSSRAGAGVYTVYYARAIDADLLAEVAEQVGADVNVYADGDLVASSREGLLAGGFISSAMSAPAYVEVSLLGSDRSLATERAGSYEFQVAYLPLDRWIPDSGSGAWSPASTRAAIAVPLLFRPESYSMEVQRATSVLLGGFALLLAATIGLGLVVARGVFEPLRELVAGTRRISRGDYDVRLREDRADEVGMVASAFNEMTERIAESQRALEERRRYLETILENIGAGVISADGEGRIRTVNGAAERITSMPAREIIGRDVRELAASSPAAKIFALMGGGRRGALASGELQFGLGERRATVKYMCTHLEAEGRPFGAVLVFEDVTELIESKKLSAWVEMARQIAHEIKNPLTPIRISTQFMRRAYEQKPADFDRIFREGTDTIIQQVDVLKRIAGEFSSYGRMQRLEMKPLMLEPLVRGIVTPYEHNAGNVRVHYENGAAGSRVLADAEAVRKICTNLIENAIEAMGPDGGELRVRCVETNEQGTPMIRISFRDTGPGLSGDAAHRLFEPYFSTKTTGTGLGLAICRTLSREMGGDVTVRNAESGGGVEAALLLKTA